MATIAALSARSGERPTLVGLSARPLSLPVRPARLLQWGVAILVVANLGRIPLVSAGDREAAVVMNDFFVAFLTAACMLTALMRRSLLLDLPALAALAFAAVGLTSAVVVGPQYGLSAFDLAI